MGKVLVTGATGFIGGYVIRELLKNGHEVVASSSNIEKAKNHDWFKDVTYRELDLGKLDSQTDYFAYFERPVKVIHLAWEGLPNYKSLFHIEENLPRHISFLKNLVANGAKDITVTGTCFEYGMQQGALREDLPTYPDNPYALAKDTLRKYLEQLRKTIPFSFKWARLFYMYGEGQNKKSLYPQLMEALDKDAESFNMSGGEQIRDFLPVQTIASHIVAIAGQTGVEGPINCCSGKPVSVLKFVNDIIAASGKKIDLNLGFYPYPDYEPMYFWGSNEKLKLITNGNEHN